MRQFLVEAVALCVLGGLIGIAFGVSAAAIVAIYAQWPVLISASVIALANDGRGGNGRVFWILPGTARISIEPDRRAAQ